jgi:hypothetical protein
MPALKVNTTLPLTGCKRQDFYDLVEGATPDTDMADGETLEIAADKVQAKQAVPRWEKFTIDYTDLAALGAVGSGAVTVQTLPDGGVIQAVKIRSTVQWAGGAISALSGEVGISGTPAKYAAAYDMWAAPGDANFAATFTAGTEENTLAGGGAGTAILLTATATGGNLDELTAGEVDVWVLWSAAVA